MDRDELTTTHVITSASNIRLKELNLDKPLIEDDGNEDCKKNKASLRETKNLIENLVETDPRIEQTNGRKNSIFSAIKWNDSRFDELVREGQNVLTHKEENELCNVIHLPDNS